MSYQNSLEYLRPTNRCPNTSLWPCRSGTIRDYMCTSSLSRYCFLVIVCTCRCQYPAGSHTLIRQMTFSICYTFMYGVKIALTLKQICKDTQNYVTQICTFCFEKTCKEVIFFAKFNNYCLTVCYYIYAFKDWLLLMFWYNKINFFLFKKCFSKHT